MKVIAIRTFSHGFYLYTANDTLTLPDELAKDFIEKGFVKPFEEGFKTMVTKEEKPPTPTRAKQTRKKK